MTAAIVALALVAAGLGVTAAVQGIRHGRVQRKLGDAQVALAKADALCKHLDAVGMDAREEIRQLRAREERRDRQRRNEHDELAVLLRQCRDPAAVRQLLTDIANRGPVE